MEKGSIESEWVIFLLQLNEKDLVIRQLKLALNEMIAAANEENNSTLNDAAKQILTDNKTLANKQSKLQEEIIDTSDRLYKDRKTNYSNEAKLRKRKFKMAGELHNWIMKYDQDMQWRQVSKILLYDCQNSLSCNLGILVAYLLLTAVNILVVYNC